MSIRIIFTPRWFPRETVPKIAPVVEDDDLTIKITTEPVEPATIAAPTFMAIVIESRMIMTADVPRSTVTRPTATMSAAGKQRIENH
jgi:hypothetical protein